MAAKRRQTSRADARCHAAFRVFVTVLAVLALFGLTRVSLSARVAEASVDADRLRADICSERLLTDVLEIDRGVLSTPERLASIASASMNMCQASDLTYLEVEPVAETLLLEPEIVVPASGVDTDDGFTVKKMIAAVMDMAAGEAQVLLVGDAGLASSR
jgi:hypothetical protein